MVIDTSVVIAVIANEPEKKAITEQTTGANLLAPASVHWEIGNAFSAMLKRQRVTLEQVRKAVVVYHQIPIRFLDVDLDDALKLADRLGIYAYDAYVIAVALAQTCDLLALDRGLIHAARQTGVNVLEVNA